MVQCYKTVDLNVEEMENDVKVYYTATKNHIFKEYLMIWESAQHTYISRSPFSKITHNVHRKNK